MLSIVQTTSGAVQGVQGVHAAIFRGIPYATARRFCPPEPVPAWSGVRLCDRFAPKCPQLPLEPGLPHTDFYLREYAAPPTPTSEDCLALNVWTPAKTPEDRLPVMVWLHGGSSEAGSGSDLPFDGEALAAEGVLLVTFNYRVGALAFFAHPALSAARPDGVSGNNDLRDQLAALRWVQGNIASFGGDPDNVTLFGQSNGGGSVACHLLMPASKGLFQKAIIQSGLGGLCARASSSTQDAAEAWGMQVCRLLDTMPEALQTMPIDELMPLLRRAEAAGEAPLHPMDGVLLPFGPGLALQNGAMPELPLLFSVVEYDRSADCEIALCRRRAAAGLPTYLAYFHPEIPGRNTANFVPEGGAYHNSELWFVFGTLERCWRPFTERHAALSQRMIRAWTQFARTGAPEGWTPWSQDGEWVADLTDEPPCLRSVPFAACPGLQDLIDPF